MKPMKRSKVHAAIAIAVLLGGCRAVLGIEELELKKDGGTDAATDASVDNLVPGDAITSDVALDALGSECRNDSDCLRCCRDNTLLRPQFSELITKASQASCLCTAPMNTCSSECSRAGCPPSGPDSDPMTCNKCVDTTFLSPTLSTTCQNAVSACQGDVTCKDAINCLLSCK